MNHESKDKEKKEKRRKRKGGISGLGLGWVLEGGRSEEWGGVDSRHLIQLLR